MSVTIPKRALGFLQNTKGLAFPANPWPAARCMDPIDRENLRITGRHRAVTAPHFTVQDDVTVVITQAFGPRGDNLVGISGVEFDGHPAITIKVRVEDREGYVHLSPLHGDGRKATMMELPHGTRCELLCPVSGQPLDLIGDVEDSSGAKYFAIYLTPALSQGSMVTISDIWGHYHSRITDEFELISVWASAQPEG
jgi:hypothetical protein